MSAVPKPRPRAWQPRKPMHRSSGTYGPAWEKVKARILSRDRYRCRIPGCTHRADDVHHIIAYAIVRRHDDWNLISLCQDCHDFFVARSR